MDIQNYLTNTFNFSFTGQWAQPQLQALTQALDRIARALEQHNIQPSLAWIQKYLGGTGFDHKMLLRRYRYVWRSNMHLGTQFSVKTVIHEFGHILDNRLAGANASV